jgi:hypothetical protein
MLEMRQEAMRLARLPAEQAAGPFFFATLTLDLAREKNAREAETFSPDIFR